MLFVPRKKGVKIKTKTSNFFDDSLTAAFGFTTKLRCKSIIYQSNILKEKKRKLGRTKPS